MSLAWHFSCDQWNTANCIKDFNEPIYFPPECFCVSAEVSWFQKPSTLGRVIWWVVGQWDAQGKSAGQETGHLPPLAWADCQMSVGVAVAAASAGDALIPAPRMFSYASKVLYR